jgi:hypothetical protein
MIENMEAILRRDKTSERTSFVHSIVFKVGIFYQSVIHGCTHTLLGLDDLQVTWDMGYTSPTVMMA